MTQRRSVVVIPRRRAGVRKAERPGVLRRRVITGAVLTCVGAAMLGWSQLEAEREAAAAVSSDETAARELEQRARQIETDWSRGVVPEDVGLLRIPRFDDDGSDFVSPIVEGWAEEDLARGVGLYADGAAPGQSGNVVLAGHRVTHGSPFAEFPELQVGDLVEVETATSILTYRLISGGTQYRVPDTTTWPTWSTPDPDLGRDVPTSKRYLTLVTCAETVHTELRNVAVGVQVSARPVARTATG